LLARVAIRKGRFSDDWSITPLSTITQN